MNLAPATAIESGVLCAALQLSDTFYPTGAYSHSHGLEGLIEEGIVRDRETLREYCLASLLPSLGRMELPLVVHAYAALASANWEQVGRLCVLSSGLRATREPRQASDAIGRQRITLLVLLRKDVRALEFQRLSTDHDWPQPAAVAAALEALAVGAPVGVALANVYYGAIATAVSSSMKLLRIGQNGGQSLLTEMIGLSTSVFEKALQVPIDEIGWFNPWLDIASARHEHASARLFIS
ncbi:MAG: urease accessory UreF family protein [Opitutaceae bacterium]|nr:urease accessory UreF family protein [Opitutaceae bacterium]